MIIEECIKLYHLSSNSIFNLIQQKFPKSRNQEEIMKCQFDISAGNPDVRLNRAGAHGHDFCSLARDSVNDEIRI